MTDPAVIPEPAQAAEIAALAAQEALLEPTVGQKFFYGLVRVTTFWPFLLGFGLRTRGWRNIPKHGPALLIANHQSYFDPLLIGHSTPRHLSYLARKTLFNNSMFAWAIRTLQAVPIDQDGVGIDGLRTVLRLLKAGKAVVVFPEGERTPHGGMKPLQPGIHLLVKKSEAPLIPIGIAGAHEAWPRGRAIPVPAPELLRERNRIISVVIGKPLDYRRLRELSKPELLDTLFQKISAAVETAECLRSE